MIPLLLSNWKSIAIGLAVIALGVFIKHRLNAAYDLGVKDTETRWKVAAYKEAEEARSVVEAAKAEAKQQNEHARHEREQYEQAERDRQAQNSQERDKVIHDLESRYRKALVEDQTCAAWSKVTVACPLR